MPIDRRTFMLHSSFFVVASSALVRLPALAQDGVSTAVPANDTFKRVEFKIFGWDRFDAGSVSLNEQFAFRVNQGWRCAWR